MRRQTICITGVVDSEAVDRCSHADETCTVQDLCKAKYNGNRKYITHLPQWPLWLALRMFSRCIRSQDCIKQYAAMAVADPNAGAHIPFTSSTTTLSVFPHGKPLAFALEFFAVIMAL